MQWNVDWQKTWLAVEPYSHHLVAICLASGVTLLVTWIVHQWKTYRYGKLVSVCLFWVDRIGDHPNPGMRSKVLWKGPALELLHSRTLTKRFVGASRWQVNGPMAKGAWKPERAAKVLDTIGDHLSRQFAAGAVARAMGDKDVTCGTFLMTAFAVQDGIEVRLIRKEDLEHPCTETWPVKGLVDQAEGWFVRSVDLYM